MKHTSEYKEKNTTYVVTETFSSVDKEEMLTRLHQILFQIIKNKLNDTAAFN